MRILLVPRHQFRCFRSLQKVATMLIWGLLVCIGIVCQNTAHAWGIWNPWGSPKNLRDAMKPDFQWKYMDYDFGSDENRQNAIRSGAYNYTNIAPIDVDYWNGKIFVTTIRDEGVPSSLNVISGKTGPGGPLLAPYPDWSWAKIGNCSGITSVYRVAIDRCDRLWVLDTGVVGTTRTCPAQLLTFDLNTSKLLKRATIPSNIALNSTSERGLLVTPVVQTFGRGCKTTYVYIADVEGYAIIIYDGNSFRRVTSDAFDYDPRAVTYTIQGQSFTLEDGPLGMALSPITQNLYFSPMSSFDLDSVDTRDLRDLPGDQVPYRVYRDVLTTQASAKAISRTGTLFFGLVNNTAIACWNEFNELNEWNIELVAKNYVSLQFTSGMKVINYNGEEVLLIFTNRFQKLATGTTDYSDVNFRILSATVEDLISGTRCQPPSPF